MTKQEINSTRNAIADCTRYIEKESRRDADLRPVEIQKRLAWYIAHREKLQDRLIQALIQN